MRVPVALGLICASGMVGVARAQEPVDQAMIARIKTEALQHSQVGALFDHLANVIGADSPGG